MQDGHKSNSLGFLISDTARLLRKRFDQRAREIGLTRAQWQVLAYLTHNQGINQAGLAEMLEIEPITLSRHIDKMEQAGWVTRRPDPNDKRVKLLFISDHVQPLLDEMRSIGRCLLDEVLEGMPPERVEQLVGDARSRSAPPSSRARRLSRAPLLPPSRKRSLRHER